ncbi:hypothetical protein EW146_g4137 [Bondarzewia mesenterica]|uniref:CHAT domain-containing protein n=1 Tax=Bondarzewia mesenterica TaxID=1095465 RepID=A0A4S4LXA6_9AGAM|nr:hypothetical protein EW146_g4137 [Bondarzewia mesenterica]
MPCDQDPKETLDLKPEDGQESADSFALAKSTFRECKEAGQLSDLENAISLLRRALDRRPEPHPLRSGSLNHLATALVTKFYRTGDAQDLGDAISLYNTVALEARQDTVDAELDDDDDERSVAQLQILQQKENVEENGECSDMINLALASINKYNHAASISSLNTSIFLHREALRPRPVPHAQRFALLTGLADALAARFRIAESVGDLDEAISFHGETLDLSLGFDPDQESLLLSLTGAFLTRFNHAGQFRDLDDALVCMERVNEGRRARSIKVHEAKTLVYLADTLLGGFDHSSEVSDLDRATLLYRNALSLLPVNHSLRYGVLANLATALVRRFRQMGGLEDLNEALSLNHDVLKQLPASHPNRQGMLHNLANVLSVRFEQTSQLTDLDEAVSLHREALLLCSAPHPDRSMSLNSLASVLFARFRQTGEFVDMDEAVSLHREALELCPPPHPGRSWSLNSLANTLSTRFRLTAQLADLDEAVSLHREALKLRPSPHPERSGSLNDLACALDSRFRRIGDLDDLNEAILLHREALELRPVPHPNRSSTFNNLATTLSARFRHTGQLADLDEAVALHREAMQLLPAPHSSRSLSLDNLANTLLAHFRQTDRLLDLDEAISLHHEALELRPMPHPDRSMSLNNLGFSLETRFRKTGRLVDIDEAILLLREGLRLCPAPHVIRSHCLTNLANALGERFGKTRQLVDLDEAVSYQREALGLHPVPHPQRPYSLNNLSKALFTRYDHVRLLSDIEDAIALSRESLDLLPLGHADRCNFSSNLGMILAELYQTRQQGSLDDVVASFRTAVSCSSAPAFERFDAAKRWARCTDPVHDSALEAYQAAIELLPRIAMFGLNLQSRQEVLTSRSDGLARDAAACAVRLGRLDKAVELLEEGRTVFWSQALRLRTPLDSLRAEAPELSKQLEGISMALEQGSKRDECRRLSDSQQIVMSIEQEAIRYRGLDEEWHATLEEIRRLDQFHDFLRPRPFAELQVAASCGPVVIINSSKSHCDMLILTSTGIKRLPLPDFTSMDAEHLVDATRLAITLSPLPQDLQSSLTVLADKLRSYEDTPTVLEQDRHFHVKRTHIPRMDSDGIFRHVLEILWGYIVEPVIRSLELQVKIYLTIVLFLLTASPLSSQKSDSPPRLWWYPTGHFAFLPIHAAGIYGVMNGKNTSDYVVSSYTHTLNALLSPLPPVANSFKVLVVIHSPTGRQALPYTRDELQKIECRVPDECLVKLGIPGAPSSVENIVSHLPSASMVHFACHGIQHPSNPLKSALLLQDGRLKVSQIMEQSMPNASLAFLSACQTAMGDENVPDEAMHLAATLLFAGFRGVVATMWSMHDMDGPKIVDEFYRYLFEDEAGAPVPPYPNTTRAARALHLAVAKLRAQNCAFKRWVPFVHLGL